jgi:hypothetical protein
VTEQNYNLNNTKNISHGKHMETANKDNLVVAKASSIPTQQNPIPIKISYTIIIHLFSFYNIIIDTITILILPNSIQQSLH